MIQEYTLCTFIFPTFSVAIINKGKFRKKAVICNCRIKQKHLTTLLISVLFIYLIISYAQTTKYSITCTSSSTHSSQLHLGLVSFQPIYLVQYSLLGAFSRFRLYSHFTLKFFASKHFWWLQECWFLPLSNT